MLPESSAEEPVKDISYDGISTVPVTIEFIRTTEALSFCAVWVIMFGISSGNETAARTETEDKLENIKILKINIIIDVFMILIFVRACF